MTDAKASKRKPRRRQPRAQSARKASTEANSASKARGRMKQRTVALEARVVVLERLLEALNNPLAQAHADYQRVVRDLQLAEEE